MNKKELIERIEGLKNLFGNKAEYIEIDAAIELISELDEPEKVKVPQFVADYIKDAKYYEWDLDDVFDHIAEESEESEIYIWFYPLGNVDILARAWLDGYEVEKEKRYIVKVKGLGHKFRVLKYNIFYNDWFTGSDREDSSFRIHHTRKQLEADGFGWVFDCEGIEIEEVTE